MRAAAGVPARGAADGIAFKIALGPVLAIIMVVILGAVVLAGVSRDRATLIALHDDAGAAVARGQQATVTMLTLQSALFQEINWVTFHGQPDDIMRMKGEIATASDALRQMSAADPSLLPGDIVASVASKLQAATRMLDINPSLGFSAVVRLQKDLVQARANLAQVLAQRTAAADTSYRSALRASAQLLLIIRVFVAGLVLILLAAVALTARTLVRGITRLTAAMRALAQADGAALAAPVPGIDRRDEIGDMARAVVVFRDGLVQARAADAAQQAEVAAKERRRLKMESEIGRFDADIRGALATLAGAASDLRGTAGSLKVGAERTSQQSGVVAAAAEAATANVQGVAAATDQMTASIREITRQIAHSTSISREAVQEAAGTQKTISGLAEAAGKIDAVVALINSIAGQTNLLALNATIEAARAGDAGKGFAVVASEVKSLANQTARATEQIRGQVGAMQQAVGEAVDAIGRIDATIGRISQVSTAIAAAMEEQETATLEIARNVQQAAQGTVDVSRNIVAVSSAAGDTGSASAAVLAASENLGGQAASLQSQVGGFLAEIRAAA